jgi:nucleoid-associated protein YgaU
MNQAVKLALLSLILVVLAVAIHRIRSTADRFDASAVISVEPGVPVERELSPGRLSQQPTILRAKPATEDSAVVSPSSPRHWDGTGTPSSSTPVDSPALFPTGRALMDTNFPSSDTSELPPPNVVQPPENGVPNGPATIEAAPPTHATEPQPYVVMPPILESPPPAMRQVTSEANDSFWRISERAYGSGQYYRALYELNRDRVITPDRIDSGVEISTPPLDELRALYPQFCPEPKSGEPSRGI